MTQRFQVSVILRFDDGETLPAGDKRVARLNQWLAHAYEGGAVGTASEVTAKVLVPLDSCVLNIDLAEMHGVHLIMQCVTTLGFPPYSVISRSVIDADTYVAELDVVGSREARELLGVSQQRLAQLRAEGRLPEPDAELAATPVWKRRTLDSFIWGWRRLPGRHSGQGGVEVPIDELARLFGVG